uniref:BZIP domain-containing protein n=1 Tax=Kwoniella dejecticola CBS 10117 TaxID=1296121 RepID=A0A1A6AFP0_9TREE|nr:uncharacterized protein I303_00710 [Kwoniella dejecticola CBS 10117]OBR88892.1 hypothetical protein I303_00710 [Kwoniella dejecticola CBS 10117]
MPQPLRPADSFNSSTATVVPDKKRSDLPSTRFWNQSSSSSSRTLGNTSSLEGHINTALRVNAGDDDGMIGILHSQTQDMGGNNLSGLSFSKPSGPSASQSSSSTTNQQFNTFNPIPTPRSDTFEPIQSPHSTFEPIPSPNTVHNPFHTLTSPVDPAPGYNFRPPSAHSYHSAATSSIDASEYYSTTDMDTDDDDLASVNDGPPLAVKSHIDDLGIADIDLSGKPAIMTWTKYQPPPASTSVSPNNIQSHGHSQAVSPQQAGISLPRNTAHSQTTAGPSRGGGGRRTSGRSTNGMTEEDKIKADKLEHRRDINRRSAQKHRLQRKKDMEEMSKKLAEKDAIILQLNRDLAVEKARNDQLRTLMNARLAGGTGNAT